VSTTLPARTSDAPLPQSYEAAKVALANCTAVDECQDWADKAAALASYARQQDDQTLFHYAKRIQARATRRVGELLKQFDGRDGQNLPTPKAEPNHRFSGSVLPPSRSQVAAAAGMSEHRQKTAVRVANIPAPDFEAAVESPKPPTITALAEQGKRPAALHDPKPAGFNEAIHTMGAMRRFADKCREHQPELIAGALASYEVAEARELVALLDSWLDRFVVNLKG
jgi:hypothetical protein